MTDSPTKLQFLHEVSLNSLERIHSARDILKIENLSARDRQELLAILMLVSADLEYFSQFFSSKLEQK